MTDEPRIPNIGERVRLVGTLIRVETPKPIQPPDEYVFENIDARVEMRLGEAVVKDFGTFNDWYGDAVRSGILEAKQICEHHRIGPTSDNEIVVVKVTSQCRQILSRGTEPYLYEKEFRQFCNMSSGGGYGVAPTIEKDVWSSKRWLEKETQDV